MPSKAENLFTFFESRLPKMENRWRKNFQMGYEHRMTGRRCAYSRRHARYMGGYMKGWNRAEKELSEKGKHRGEI